MIGYKISKFEIFYPPLEASERGGRNSEFLPKNFLFCKTTTKLVYPINTASPRAIKWYITLGVKVELKKFYRPKRKKIEKFQRVFQGKFPWLFRKNVFFTYPHMRYTKISEKISWFQICKNFNMLFLKKKFFDQKSEKFQNFPIGTP